MSDYKIRSDLIISPQEFEGKNYFVIKDPLSFRFFRIKEPEYFIIQKLDGKSTHSEICQAFSEKFNIALNETDLNKFIERLDSLGFLEKEGFTRETARLHTKTRTEKKSLFQKIVFLKLKAFNPDRFLDKLYPYTKLFFTHGFILFSAISILLALYITVTSWGSFKFSLNEVFRSASLIYIWITIFWVIGLHEFAHALTCKHFGGKVSEMGFLLLYFQLCFYTDISDAWLFKEKRKKILVTLAGAYFQLFIWSGATILWRITDPETNLNFFFFISMLVSGVAILFNFNPLIKLDGYYLLSDWLEIPNLRKKAFLYLKLKFLRQKERLKTFLAGISAREKKILPYFGILALIYSVFLIGFFFLKLEEFLVTRYQGWGLTLFAAILILLFKEPLKNISLAGLGFLMLTKNTPFKPKKLVIILSVTIFVLLILIFVKADLRISKECTFQALESYVIANRPGAFLEEQLFQEGAVEKREINVLRMVSSAYGTANLEPIVKEGQSVKKGDTIAYLTSNQYINELNKLKAGIQKSRAKYELLKKGPKLEVIEQAQDKVTQAEILLENETKDYTRAKELFEKKLISNQEWEYAQTDLTLAKTNLAIAKNELKDLETGARPEELQALAAEIKELEAQETYVKSQLESSIIKSPIDGIVTGVKPQGNLISISRFDTIRVLIPAVEKDLDVLAVGQKIKAKTGSYPWKSFYGKVTKIAQKSEDYKFKNVFWVTGKISNSQSGLKPGMNGHAKIYCDKRSLLYLLTRGLIRYLRVEVWSWW